MTNDTVSISPTDARAYIAEHRTWFTILGICLLVLGTIAIIFPFLATVAVKVFIGWIFLIGGIVQISHAFSTRKWSGFLWNMLVGALYLIVGAWLAFFPLAGIITLTILLALMFVFQGAFETALALRLRPQEGWGWILVAGVVAALVGILIFMQLPSSAAWAIGLLAGINMISSGWAYLFMVQSAKKG